MVVNIRKLSENAEIPKYSTVGSAGLDMVATRIISDTPEQITYGTDLAIEIPEGHVGLIYPRSSIRKTGLQLSNSVGVIDSDYRGEIQFTFNKIFGSERFYDETKLTEMQMNDYYRVGDRIGQLMIIPYPQIKFNEVSELTDTVRGDGGFGSTGA